MLSAFPSCLDKWLSYLETLHPKAIDLGLERIKIVADRLNLTKPATFVITVTGTNGKGSCVTSLAGIYQEAGYRVGAYTSPHLWHFTERVAINGVPVPESQLCAAFEQIEKAREEISLSYFEFTTLAAFSIFQRENLDVAILEVGMGGRLDAVNIIDCDVAIITTVDLDHEQWLGDTREKIGVEKAGILRKHRPLVAGRDLPETVYQEARKLNCPVYILGNSFEVEIENPLHFSWKSDEKIFKKIPKNHLRVDNIALSLKAVRLLDRNLPVSDESIIRALQECRLPGRQQVIEKPIWQMFDVAHNPQGVVELSAALQATAKPGVKTLAVFSMLRDKAVGSCIAAIASNIDEWFVSGLNIDRGMNTKEVVSALNQVTSKPVHAYSGIVEAYEAACRKAEANKVNNRVVIFGSFHVVAETLANHSWMK